MDNMIITELDESGNSVGEDYLIKETFSSGSFDTNIFTFAGSYASDW